VPTHPLSYDAELRRHNEVLRRAAGVQVRDRVLDIGCGTGQTTRQAARAALAGSALGIDVAADAIGHARELGRQEGLSNLTFEHANAQAYPFAEEGFDLVISRFGTMFFDDPSAAFANIRRALGPGGRLVMMVWQARDRNEWDVTICQALAAAGPSAVVPAGGPDPFSLGHAPAVTRILEAAGFADVTFTDVHEPVYYGQDVATALGWVQGFASTRDLLRRLDQDAAAGAIEHLRAALAARLSDDGIRFDSRAWIVTACRR
jgi:SAM-dependent methyltransferase